MKVIEVVGYDCCRYTDSIWVNEDMSKKQKVNLGDFGDDRDKDNLYKALKGAGFKKVKQQEVSWGGNY